MPATRGGGDGGAGSLGARRAPGRGHAVILVYACTPPKKGGATSVAVPAARLTRWPVPQHSGPAEFRPSRAIPGAQVPMKSVQPRRWMPHALIGGAGVAVALLVMGLTGGAQQKGEWPLITGSDAGTRYSPLDQINAANFNTLKVAWEWDGKDVPPGVEIGEINARGLPIYVDGHAHHRVGPAPHRRVARPGHRQDAVDVPGADDAAPRLLDAVEPRQGRGLPPHQRARRRARHDPGLLPARARRQDR